MCKNGGQTLEEADFQSCEMWWLAVKNAKNMSVEIFWLWVEELRALMHSFNIMAKPQQRAEGGIA